MSNYIEIDKKPVIFDDLYMCGECDYVNIENTVYYCNLFNIGLHESQWDCAVKCDECKKAWKAAKERQSKPCPECKNLRGIDEDGAFVCDCKHCGDEVPF